MADLAQEPEALRNAILDDLSGWIQTVTPAVKADRRLRDAVVRRAVDDVTDVVSVILQYKLNGADDANAPWKWHTIGEDDTRPFAIAVDTG